VTAPTSHAATPTNESVRDVVREHYAKVARGGTGCCGGASGCASSSLPLGYTDEDLSSVPDGADLGLGCGNPQAIAAIRPGEAVLDLGSGGGFDCFLAARQVGAAGRVVGADMTPDMVAKARANARKIAAGNVEFRLGAIEHVPVADGTIDVVISNCVVNLSPEKPQVYKGAFRVLRRGGRIAISDVVATRRMPVRARPAASPSAVTARRSPRAACASGRSASSATAARVGSSAGRG
jgi:arsenite methyltransferase